MNMVPALLRARTRSTANAIAALALAVFAMSFLADINVIWNPQHYGELGLALGQPPIGGSTVFYLIPGSAADRAGIKLGDAVERPPALRERILLKLNGFIPERPGEQMTIFVDRAGERHKVMLQARPMAPLSGGDRLIYILQHINLLIFVAVGLILVLLRPSHMTWGFYLFAFTLVVLFIDRVPFFTLPAYWLITLIVAWDSLVVAGGVGFLVFCIRFPANAPTGWRRILDSLTPYIFAVFAVLVVSRDLAAIEFAPDRIVNGLNFAFNTSGAVFFSLATVIFFVTFLASRGPDRQKIVWVVFGLACAAIATAEPLLNMAGLVASPAVLSTIVHLLYVALPLSVAYAVIRYRVIDVRFVARRSLTLGLIGSILALTVIGIDWFFSARLPNSRLEEAAYVLIILLVGFTLNAARQAINKSIDFLFFRQWYRTQEQAEALAEVIRRAGSELDLYTPLTAGIASTFSIGSAALFERVEDGGFIRVAAYAWPAGTLWHIFADDPLVKQSAQRARVASVDALQWQGRKTPAGAAEPTTMVPITAAGKVPAILLCGAHHNGASLDADEIRTIRGLCADAGSVYGAGLRRGVQRSVLAPAR